MGKKSRFKLWRSITAVLCILLAISCALTSAAFQWQNTITRYLGISGGSVSNADGEESFVSDYDTIEELFEAKEALCIQIGEEGSVLLKNNNNALPIDSNAKISLFGRNSTDFVVGTSSGGGVITGDDDLKTVLTSVGLSVNETLWDFYSNSDEPKRRSSTDGVRIGEIDPNTYTDEVISSYDEYSDAAIVVISRNFGEGNDASTDPADVLDGDGTHYSLQLQDVEWAVIEEAKKCSDNVIVIVNSDNAIEVGDLKEDSDIDAILQVGGTGVYGLYGVANLLIGETSPSGHLVDTYAVSNFSSPAAFNYGDFTFTNSDYTYIVYQEGIYVGYKYYETRYEDSVMGSGNAVSEAGAVASEGDWNYAEEVAYSFGYGLSYSEFTQEIKDIEWNLEERTVEVTVEVKNVGDYDGKDVVQLYVQSPYTDYDKENNVEKASVQLIGYEKTGVLEAGTGTETVTITADLDFVASYDYTEAMTYILDYGKYYFAVGNGAHDAVNNVLAAKGYSTDDGMDYDGDTSKVIAYEYSGDGEVDAQTCSTSRYTGTEITNNLESIDVNSYGDYVTYLSRQDWTGTWSGPVELAASDEMIDNVENGSSYTADTSGEAPVEGEDYASEATDYNFYDLKGLDYDDPIWDDLLSQLTLDEMTRLVGLANSGVVESINMPSYLQFDGPLGIVGSYQTNNLEYAVSATQYPSEPMWASSFNHELAEEIGKMYGNDGLWTGYQAVWGPGCDTHRTPFCGRNAEYFSEDSVMAYYFAKEMSLATIEYGLSCGPKHLALNDQEVNRSDALTFSNEQATREIYLRAFEGAMAAGGALDCMTAKNLMGTSPAASLASLLQNVIIEEWGYHGAIISDSSTETNGSGAYAVVAGLTQFDTMTKDYISGSGSISPEKIASDATLFAAMKEACHRNLYMLAHTSLMNNLSEDTEVKETMAGYQIAVICVSIVLAAATLAGFVMMFLSDRKRRFPAATIEKPKKGGKYGDN